MEEEKDSRSIVQEEFGRESSQVCSTKQVEWHQRTGEIYVFVEMTLLEQFFKYMDDKGYMRISAKTKGGASLTNMQWGNFLDLTKEVLLRSLNSRRKTEEPIKTLKPLLLYKRDKIIEYNDEDSDDEQGNEREEKIEPDHIPEILLPLARDPNCQSISFELCGRCEPHLVSYDFDIDLKPLFKTLNNGAIQPILIGRTKEEKVVIREISDVQSLSELCQKAQREDFEMNEEFRRKHNLKHRYEYEHFITEGYVLYLLDKNNYVVNRTMYKVKPRDIEEVSFFYELEWFTSCRFIGVRLIKRSKVW